MKIKNYFRNSMVFCLCLFSLNSFAVIKCPDTIPKVINSKTVPGWLIGHWPPSLSKASNRKKYNFINADILKGNPGDEKKSNPSYLLSYEEIKQGEKIIRIWHLKQNKRDNLVLLCQYRQSDYYLLTKIPPRIKECREVFRVTNPGSVGQTGVIAESMSCK